MRPIALPDIAFKMIKLHDKFFAPLCKKYGINQTTFNTIIFVAEDPEHNTARDISKRHSLKSAILSISVEAAIQNGYLRRENDKDDRRIQRLTITDAAIPLIEDGRKMHEKFKQSIYSNLTDEEVESLDRILLKLSDIINDLDPQE